MDVNLGLLRTGHAVARTGNRIYFEALGWPRAEPLLMLQGLGADRNGWRMQRYGFSGLYRTIVLDNRGVGRSDKPYGSYSLLEMADEAVAVLDHLGIERAHVMGASMGGALAQLVTTRHPDRVRSLVLSCTACHNPRWREELLVEWRQVALERGMSVLTRRTRRWVMAPRSVRRYGAMLGLLGPVTNGCPPHAFAAQVDAILDADHAGAAAALPSITVPTLVIVGGQDILTPRADSEELADRIPNAELVVISGAAHGLMIEHAGVFNRVVLDFLGRVRRADRDERELAA